MHVYQTGQLWRVALATVLAICLAGAVLGDGQLERFAGTYEGSAHVIGVDGIIIPRDMSVRISETKDGFEVQWTSITYRSDGKVKEKSYEIEFVPSDRPAVFAAAQRRNVFGHEVQLDPMKGEPYVWARLVDDTLTVYSLFVGEDGGYGLQQYDRTLADKGLNLRYQVVRNGDIQRAVETFLTRTD